MKNLSLLFLITCLTGCSITGRYYLRNLSDQPATVTIVLNDSSASALNNARLKYDDQVRDIKFGTFKSLEKEIVLKQVDSGTLECIIPPRSTVFIGVGLNTRFFGSFHEAKIKVGDKEVLLTTDDSKQMNVRMDGLMKYTGHYDIRL